MRDRSKVFLSSFLMIVVFAIWLFPLVWMILTALRREADVATLKLQLFPMKLTTANFVRVFEKTHILAWMKNTLIFAALTVVFTILVDAPIAFAFSKIRTRESRILFWIVMAGMMIPEQVIIIPLYILMNKMGILDTTLSILFPRLALPIGVFILKQFFEDIPDALLEAAYIDGAGRPKAFIQVVVPLSLSAITTVEILSFVGAWNDFLWPLIAINTATKQVITVGIANFQNSYEKEYALVMSGAVIASVPSIIFYAIFHKKIISGIATTGIKG